MSFVYSLEDSTAQEDIHVGFKHSRIIEFDERLQCIEPYDSAAPVKGFYHHLQYYLDRDNSNYLTSSRFFSFKSRYIWMQYSYPFEIKGCFVYSVTSSERIYFCFV